MSETKYILIYPFESRERALDIANDIDGSLMWQHGTAYPRDNIPAFIVPVSEFSGRWTAPRQIEQQQQTIKELKKDAARYQYLRDADIDAVYKGGLFAGQTPENLVINGQDLDDKIDEALTAQHIKGERR